MGKVTMDAALAVATVGIALMVTNWVSGQAQQLIPGTQGQWTGLAVKVGSAALVVWGANQFLKDPGLRKVAFAGAAFVPVTDALSKLMPGALALPAPALPKPLSLGMPPGPRLSDYTLDAALEAELQGEMERGSY